MACEFCGEQNNSRLGMRSEIVNRKARTIEICSPCLGKKLMLDKSKMGNNYQPQTNLSATSSKTHAVYNPGWTKMLVDLYNSSKNIKMQTDGQ